MNRKSRYSLLGLGFLVFVLAAPLIVLYVRGVGFDFKTKTFVKTGIISVSAEPNNSDIYLDGILKRQSSGDIKFVPAGEYQVDIKKDGYFAWSKRLTVNAGEVTWASPSFNKIYLFLQSPALKNISTGVLDFYFSGNKLFVLKDNVFIASTFSSLAENAGFLLPKAANKLVAHDDSNTYFILANPSATSSASTYLFINANSGKINDISGMFSAAAKFQFNGQDLFALDNNSLYKINPAAKTKTLIGSNLDSFYFENGSLYFAQSTATGSSVGLSSDPYNSSTTLLSNLPLLKNSALLVTPQKQIFILNQGTLYIAGSTMQKLADNVSQWSFDPATSVISVIHSGELDYFDRLGNTLSFITRNGSQISNPVIKSNIDNAFYLNQGNIYAIELDTRSSQNQSALYNSGTAEKFFVDDAAKTIYLLDKGILNSLTIR